MAAHLRVPSLSALLANLSLSTPQSSSGSQCIDWTDPTALSALRAQNKLVLRQWQQQHKAVAEDDSKAGSFARGHIRTAEWTRGGRTYVDPFANHRQPNIAAGDARHDDEEETRWRELERREQRESEMRQTREERKEQQPSASAAALPLFPRPARHGQSLAPSSSSSSSLFAPSGRRDFRWLLARCESAAHDGSAMTSLDIASSTLQLLQSKKSDEQLQSDLLDLMGVEAVELVGELLQHRHELRKAALSDLERATSPQPAVYSAAPRVAPPQLLGVSVTSQRAKDAAKAARKEDRRMARLTSKDTSADFVARQQQADAERLEEQARSLDQWRSAAVTEKSTALPAGSLRTEHKGYEEVYIPPTLPAHFEKEELVPIAALDAWARPVFGATNHLNRIQSKCYQAAYKHNNNLLVCAPTGSGKVQTALSLAA